MTEKIINRILSLKDIKDNQEEVKNRLAADNEIGNAEKRCVWLYLYPRELGDYELPKRVYGNRVSCGNEEGWLVPEYSEIALLVEAARSQQYSRFMKHLVYSFIVDPGLIYNPLGRNTVDCCISGKNLMEYDLWNDNVEKYDTTGKERKEKRYLAFGSEQTEVNLSIDSIIQLNEMYKIMKGVDPGYIFIRGKR